MNIEKIIMDSTMNKSYQEILKYMNDNNIQIPINLQFKLLNLNSLPLIISETYTLEICFGVFFLQILKQSQNQNTRNQLSISVNPFQQLKDINQQIYIQLCRAVFKKTLFNLDSLILDLKTVDDYIKENFIAEINMLGKYPQIYQSTKYNNQETIKYRIFLYQDQTAKLYIIFSMNNQTQSTFPQQQFKQSQSFNFKQLQNQQQQFKQERSDSFPIQKQNQDQNIVYANQYNNIEVQKNDQIHQQFQFNNNNIQFSNQINKQINIQNQQQKNFNINNLQNNFNQNNLFNSVFKINTTNQNTNENTQNNNTLNQFNLNNSVYNKSESLLIKNNNVNPFSNNTNNVNISSCNSDLMNQQIHQQVNTLTNNNKPCYQFNNPSLIQQNNNIAQQQQQQYNLHKEPQNNLDLKQNAYDQQNNNTQQEVDVLMTEQLNPQYQVQKVQNEYGRLSTNCIKNETDNSQYCHVCFSSYNSNSDEAIMTPCCNKIVHRECMQMDLNEKAKQSLNFSKIDCFNCKISLQNYKDFLKLNIPKNIFFEIIKIEVLANIALKCCKCQLPIQVSQDKKQLSVQCLNCNTMLCRLCYQQYHGENETNQQCPSLLKEIQKAIQGMPILVCPFCNLMQTKDDHCNHVNCFGCKRDLCSACSVDREPILIHGNLYHREGCDDYRPFIINGQKSTIPEFDRRNCKICKETNKPCQFPISLEEYRKQKQF